MVIRRPEDLDAGNTPGGAHNGARLDEGHDSTLFRNLFTHAPIAMLVTMGDGRILAMNQAAVALLGTENERDLGHDVADFFEERAQAARFCSGLRHDAGMPERQVRMRRSDGSVLHALVSVRGEWLDDDLVRSYWFMRDNSSQSELDEALQRETEQRRLLAASVPFITWLTDVHGTLTYVNPRCAEYAGYSAEQCVSLGWEYLLHPDDEPLSFPERSRKKQHTMRHRLRDKTGEYRWHQSSAVPVFAPDGSQAGWLGSSTDIHAQVAAEEALRTSESRLRTAQEAARIGTFEWHVPTNQLVWDGVEPIHGLRAGSFGGSFDAYLADMHPEDRERVMGAITTAVESAGEIDIEYRIIWPDGTLRWVAGKGRTFTDEDGHTVRVTGTCQDVTARKQFELALASSEARYRGLIETMPANVTAAGLDGGLTYVGSGWVAYTGLPESDLLGYGWANTFHPEDRPRVVAEYAVAVAEKREYQSEFRVRRHDGAYRWFLGRMLPVFAATGAIEGWMAACIDVEDAKRAEHALRESEERYRSLSEVLPAMVTVSDPSGRIIFANQQLLDYTGVPFERLAEGDWYSVFHPEDLAAHSAEWGAALQRGEFVEGEFRARRHDGVYRWQLGRVAPVKDESGQVIRWVAAHIDIDDRKKMEDALEARVLQQASVAALGQLALSADEPQRVMDEAVRQLADCLGVELTKVLELLPTGDALLLRAGVGWQDGLVGNGTVSAGLESQAGFTLASSSPVIVEDLSREQRFKGPSLLLDHHVVSGMSTVIRGDRGKPFGVLGIHTTQRREFSADDLNYLEAVAHLIGQAVQSATAQAALRDSEARSRAVLDTAVDGIITIDERGIVESLNPAAERIFGYTSADVRGQNVSMLMPSPDREQHDGYIEHYRRTGERRIIGSGREVLGRRKDGTTFPFDLSVSEVLLGERRIFTGIVHDISDRKLAEEALTTALAQTESARALLDTLLLAAPVGFVVLDSDHRFILVNEEAANINGVAIEDHVGQQIFDPLPDVESQVQLLDRAMAGEVVRDVEIGGSTPAAPSVRRYWLASYYPVYRGSDVVAVGVAFREITERKIAEQEREQLLADLQRANAAKDEFLGLVSHELKTPITTIFGNAEVLRRRGSRLDEQSRNDAIADISIESERLHRIIDNLLVLARLERGQALASEPVLVHRVAQRLVDDHEHHFPHRKVALYGIEHEGLPVLGEPLYIEQVLRNLLSNAEKYSPADQPIEVRIARTASSLEVHVIDRGAGFPPEEAEALFTPFYRSNRTAGHAAGVGIGLAVCKRLIEAQEGTMWARAGAEGGSDIGFALPLAEDLD